METIRIEIQGVLGESWKEWFENMTIKNDGMNTIISGPCEDQAAFHGILNRIRDLNLILVSIISDHNTQARTIIK